MDETFYVKVVGTDVLTNEVRTLWIVTYNNNYSASNLLHGWLRISEVTYYPSKDLWYKAYRGER